MSGRVHVLVPAAGVGHRYRASSSDDPDSSLPKQLLEIKGRTVLEWTCHVLLEVRPVSITIAIPEALETDVRASLAAVLARGDCDLTLVAGGERRQESVWQCLSHVLETGDASDQELVLVHDAARPALAVQDLRAVVETARQDGVDGAVLGRSVTDTLKRLEGEVLGETIDRTGLFRVETPQVFRLGILRRAFEQARTSGWSATDESTLVERFGGRLRAVEASGENPKLTTALDLRRIERLLDARAQS